ncbi:MAG: hypothetical protein ACYC61_31075 [Isosphaeraceae bacterium]
MDEPIKARMIRVPRRRDDLDEMLALAEKLKRECEDHIARRERLKLMQFMAMGLMGAILLLSMSMASLQTALRSPTPETYVLFFSPLVFLPVFAGFFLYYNRVLRRNRRWFLTDSMALREVVRLLRESEVAMVGDRKWSALDRARFRIQLTRFDIGDAFEVDFSDRAEAEEARAYAEARRINAETDIRKAEADLLRRRAAVSDS